MPTSGSRLHIIHRFEVGPPDGAQVLLACQPPDRKSKLRCKSSNSIFCWYLR